MKRTFPLFSVLLIISLFLGACGPSSDGDAAIATAVALTVQARDATQPGIVPSATPRAEVPTATVLAGTSTATPQPTGQYANCMSASLVSENPPDKTIFYPSDTFFKTWHIQNTSECNWNTNYKLVFWSGDQMDGFSSYNLPLDILAGESADISIQLKAPTAAGTYKGEWKLQTPDGQIFGVGSYQTAFWTEIQVVAASVTPTFGVTSVTYEIERDPVSGCPTNVFFTFRAVVTFSGPMEMVHLQFQHSDGARSNKFKLEITGASTQTFTDKWSFHRTASHGPKWVRLTQVFPEYREFDQLNFSYECN